MKDFRRAGLDLVTQTHKVSTKLDVSLTVFRLGQLTHHRNRNRFNACQLLCDILGTLALIGQRRRDAQEMIVNRLYLRIAALGGWCQNGDQYVWRC